MSKNVSTIKALNVQMYGMLEKKCETITIHDIPYYFMNFHNQSTVDSGTYANYYKIPGTNLGLKLYKDKYKRLGNLARSRSFLEAKEEISMLNLSASSGFTPKVAHEVIVKRKGYYRIGIIMEHINGRALFKVPGSSQFSACNRGNIIKNNSGYDLFKFLFNRLKEKTRVKHLDLHSGNIIVGKSGKLYIIDFSPDHCRLARRLK